MAKSNSVVGLVIFYFVLSGLGTVWDGLLAVGIQQGYQPEQPIAFSQITCGENGVDAIIVILEHVIVKAQVFLQQMFVNCHTYINEGRSKRTQEISKIYAAIGFDPETRSYIEDFEQQPIEWIRIHNLPDLAYFNHSQHVNVAGVKCQECHGQLKRWNHRAIFAAYYGLVY